MIDLTPATPPSEKTYATAIVFATFSLIVALLITPPLFWHARNRNIGATVLVACAIYSNLQSFINALIWSNDDLDTWYQGQGLCDIEIKLQVWLQSVYPAATSCVLRALARVMDTERASWANSVTRKRRTVTIDLVCCLGIPAVQMVTHYIVQPFRFYVLGIAGCSAAIHSDWLAIVLMVLPPMLWTLFDVYLSILIITRLIRYRRTLNTILANSSSTRSRFFRLYALCGLCTLAYFPLQIYVMYTTIAALHGIREFSWNKIHHPTEYEWNAAFLVPSGGVILYDRYTWLAGGVVIFLLFGFGRDATKMYRDGLLACGLVRCFPSLHDSYHGSIPGARSSMSGRVKIFFSKESSRSQGGTLNSLISGTTAVSTIDEEKSPRTSNFLKSIKVDQTQDSRLTRNLSISGHRQPNPPPNIGNAWQVLKEYFKNTTSQSAINKDDFHMEEVHSAQQYQVRSQVLAEPISPTMAPHIGEQSLDEAHVLVTKEIRQKSEPDVKVEREMV